MGFLDKLFRKLQQPQQEATNSDTDKQLSTINELIAKVLVVTLRQGEFAETDVTFEGNTACIVPYDVWIDCQCQGIQTHSSAKVYSLVYTTTLRSGRQFTEMLTGIATGNNPIANALQAAGAGANSFIGGFLNTLILSLKGHYLPEFEIVVPEKGEKWHLIHGDLQVQGGFKDDPDLDEKNFTSILFPSICEVLPRIEGDIHFIKIYLSRQPNGKFIGDCIFDNQDWQTGLNVLLYKDYDKWKPSVDFLAKKQFIVLKRCVTL